MFSLICVWINDWVNNAGDLRRNRAHYDVIVMAGGHRMHMHIYYNGEDHVLPSYVCLQPVSNRVGNDARNIWWIECWGRVGWGGGGHYLDIENVICNNLIVEIRDIPSPTPSYGEYTTEKVFSNLDGSGQECCIEKQKCQGQVGQNDVRHGYMLTMTLHTAENIVV